MGLIQDTKDLLQRSSESDYNSIPFTYLPRVSEKVPGIMQGTYYLLGAYSSVGKTNIGDDTFLFSVYDWVLQHPHVKVKWFYESFEINKNIKMVKGASRKVFLDTGLRLDVQYLLNRKAKYRCSQEHLDLARKALDYMEPMEDMLQINDEPLNPEGVRKRIYDYCTHPSTAKVLWETYEDEYGKQKKRIISYQRRDPNEYVIGMLDHASLTSVDSGSSLKQTIDKMSSNYVWLRNIFGITPVVIQQVGTDSINREARQAEDIIPGPETFADSKYAYRDANVVFTVAAPHMFEMGKFKKYQVTKAFRYLQCIKNRDGDCPFGVGLYMDGGVNKIYELPIPDDLTSEDYERMARWNWTPNWHGKLF